MPSSIPTAAFPAPPIPSAARAGPSLRTASAIRRSTTTAIASAAPLRPSTRTIRSPCSRPCNTRTRATTINGSRMPATRSSTAPISEHPPSIRAARRLGPAAGHRPLVFGSNGMLQSGTLTQPHGSWAGSYSPNIQDAINTGSAVPGRALRQRLRPRLHLRHHRDGLYFQNETRDFDHSEDTKDCLGQRQVGHHSTGCTAISMPSTSMRASSTTTSSWPRARWPTISTAWTATASRRSNCCPVPTSTMRPGDCRIRTTTGFPSSKGMRRTTAASNPRFAADVKYDINKGGWLDSLKAGVRYADRSQTRALFDVQLDADRGELELQWPGLQRRQHLAGRLSGVRRGTSGLSRVTAPVSGAPRISTVSTTTVSIRTARWCS